MNAWLNTTTQDELADYCRCNSVRRLFLFGSCLHGKAQAESDIDLLVEFEAQARVGLFRLAQMEMELTERLGRKVDLRTAQELSRHFRQQVREEAQVIYAEK